MKRRHFLQGSLATLGVGMMQAALRPGIGWAQSTASRRFVSVQLPGAPPRWMYDFFPAAYGREGLDVDRNLTIATNYASTNGRYTAPEFSTVSVKGLNAPPFWQLQVPRAGGGLRPVSGLLDHLLSLQGVNTSVDGHETCQRLHWQPVAGQQSRSAMAADNSDNPLPAVSVQTATYAFQSTRDKSYIPLAELEENPLSTLLQPFLATLPTASPSLQAALQRAESALDADATRWAPTASETQASQAAAFTLFQRGFGDLESVFQQRVAVYRDLIRRSLSMHLPMPGFTDLPIGSTGGRDATYSLGAGAEGEPISTRDLRDIFVAETNAYGLAEQFVITEYLLREDLSRSLAIGAPPLSSLGGEGNPYDEQIFDEHGTGVMVSVLLNAKYYAALSACLLELIDQLTAANIFDDTVIEVAGEFSRSALPEGEGSDHGWPGKVSSYYSGRIRGPHVIGNVYSTPPDDSGFDPYPGTWGYGAPVDGVQSTLSLNHEIATLAAMLGVPSPTNAVPALVSVNASGEIVPAPGIEPARIVRV